MDEVAGETYGRRADFDGAAMLFDTLNAGFSPDRPDLRVLEVARHALARGHNVIDARSMEELLSGKFANPMMGLMAAHLLLLDKQPNLDLAEVVIANTGTLIGADFPDLLALAWKLDCLKNGDAAPDAQRLLERVKTPPMLQLSWHYLMEASRSVLGKVSLDAQLLRLSGSVVSSSVWLSWVDTAPLRQRAPWAPSPTVVPADTSAARSADVSRDEVAGEAISVGVAYMAGKLGEWLRASGPADITLTLPPEGGQAPGPAAGSDEGGMSATELASEALGLLVEKIDWSAVVKHLKSDSLGGTPAVTLSPLQRQLILALKAAREQFEDEGKISFDGIKRWLITYDVPEAAIAEGLKQVGRIAAGIALVATKK
jgi:hypothetical protein